MNQGYSHGHRRMPMPQYNAQTGTPTRPQYNTNHYPNNFGARNQTDNVMSQLSSMLEQADQSELQELHDKEEKLHELLNNNAEVNVKKSIKQQRFK